MITEHSFNTSIDDFKRLLARRLMLGFVVICTLGLPLSLARWPDIGFQAIYVVHSLVAVATYVCFFRKNKQNPNVDFVVIVGLLSLMAISGTLSFGLQTGAVTFATFCSFIVMVAWGKRQALVYSVMWCLFLIVIGLCRQKGLIEFAVAPEVYSKTFSAWVIVALGSSLTIVFILTTAEHAFQQFRELLTQIEKQKREIEKLAQTDAMTGFFRDSMCHELITKAIHSASRTNTQFTLLFIDLNEFKAVNDNYGHHIGDELLIEFAKRSQTIMRGNDILCRVGGDEFVFVMPDVFAHQSIKEIITRLQQAWHQPLSVKDTVVDLDASIGVAIYPSDGTHAGDLLKHADQAMYSAKRQQRAFTFYAELSK